MNDKRAELTVVASSATLAPAVVVVLVEESSTGLGTLRDTLSVLVGVNIDFANITLENGLVPDRPTDNVYIDGLVWPSLKASKDCNPLVKLLANCSLDLSTLSCGDLDRTLPTDTVVDLALGSHDLIITIVLEGEWLTIVISFHLMVPYLLERLDEVGRRVPGCLAQVTLGCSRSDVIPCIAVIKAELIKLADRLGISSTAVEVLVYVYGYGASEGGGREGRDGE